jgi:MacB-like protein
VRPVAGRLFADTDRGAGESPVVVNAAASARYFSGAAVGHTLETEGRRPRHMRIVGVVPNLRHRGPAAPTRPEMYILPDPNSSDVRSPRAIVMRLRDGASVTQERLKAAADSIGPRVLVGRIRPGTDLVGEQVAKSNRCPLFGRNRTRPDARSSLRSSSSCSQPPRFIS